jgi:hypothetical protein
MHVFTPKGSKLLVKRTRNDAFPSEENESHERLEAPQDVCKRVALVQRQPFQSQERHDNTRSLAPQADCDQVPVHVQGAHSRAGDFGDTGCPKESFDQARKEAFHRNIRAALQNVRAALNSTKKDSEKHESACLSDGPRKNITCTDTYAHSDGSRCEDRYQHREAMQESAARACKQDSRRMHSTENCLDENRLEGHACGSAVTPSRMAAGRHSMLEATTPSGKQFAFVCVC